MRAIYEIMAEHRAVEGVADYEDSPTMRKMKDTVTKLVQRERAQAIEATRAYLYGERATAPKA